jgi:hypothetical protein
MLQFLALVFFVTVAIFGLAGAILDTGRAWRAGRLWICVFNALLAVFLTASIAFIMAFPLILEHLTTKKS